VFGEYARKSKDSVFGPFLNMLNRPDTFTVNQVSHNCWYLFMSEKHTVFKSLSLFVYDDI